MREQPTLISLSSFHHLRVDFESVEDIVEGSSLLPRLQTFRPESVEAPVQHVIKHLETLLAHENFFFKLNGSTAQKHKFQGVWGLGFGGWGGCWEHDLVCTG